MKLLLALPAVLSALCCCGTVLQVWASAPAYGTDRKIDPKRVTRPQATELFTAETMETLLERGEKLFDSLQFSENGLTCKSCHFNFEAYEESFKRPYPHPVAMAKKRAGLDQVAADEMVQLCLIVTMDSKPLDWQSPELGALTAYVLAQQSAFINRAGED